MKTPMYYVNLISGLLVVIAGPCLVLMNRSAHVTVFLSEIDELVILAVGIFAAASAYTIIINAVERSTKGKPSNLNKIDFDTLIKIQQQIPKTNLFLVELHKKGKFEVETMNDSRLHNRVIGHFYQKKHGYKKSWYLTPVTQNFEPNSMTFS